IRSTNVGISAVIKPSAGLTGASEISNLSVTGEGHQIKFTASFCVVNRRDGIKSIDALLTDADDALYVAKKKERNLVEISP
ncbi:MAG: hypothetical protein ACXWUK_13310, partial [Burkholderiales bacterium]